MKGEKDCERCGKKFAWSRSKNQILPKYCSMECRGHTGFRPGCSFRISELTDEEKFEKLKKSFEKHVIRQEGCWDWKGSIAHGGYPVMSCRPEIGPTRAHQASWVIHNGIIPKGFYVCHKCDNPTCTNPQHLWLGTHKENNDDKMAKGRHAWGQPPHKVGSENGSSKLTEEQVKEIKILIEKGLTNVSIGKQYGVSKTTILRIKNKTHWNHVEVS